MDDSNLSALCRSIGQALHAQHMADWEGGKEQGARNRYGASLVANDKAERLVVDSLLNAGLSLNIWSFTSVATEQKGADFTLFINGISDAEAYLAASAPTGDGSRRYGTMFGLFRGDQPTFNDGVVSCIVEYNTGRILIVSEAGATIESIDGSNVEIARVSRDRFGSSIIYCESQHPDFGRILKLMAVDPLERMRVSTTHTGSAASNILDIATGAAQGVLAFSAEGQRAAPPIAYHIITQAGGCALTKGSLDPVSNHSAEGFHTLPEVYIFGNSVSFAAYLRTTMSMFNS